jgi:SAM-dependent methyltransferase
VRGAWSSARSAAAKYCSLVRQELLERLADPAGGTALQLVGAREEHGEIVEGTLRGRATRYAIREAIPRFLAIDDEGQAQTQAAFAYKWTKPESFGSAGMREQLHAWLLERYGFASREEMRGFFAAKPWTLDAGCGAGFATSAWMDQTWTDGTAQWVGLDISRAIDVARDTLGSCPGTHFVQGDVSRPPFRSETFDAVVSEGVLHHTPSTRAAFDALVGLLRPGGELLAYVYRRKAPIREFTDDFVREQLQGLAPEEAWAAMRPLTRLAKALADLGADVDVPEDVPLLGIQAGRYDVQRLIYWNVAKLFWNPALTFDENVHLNFDWYAPTYAHRHTEDEVRTWCADARLHVTRLDVQEAGLTVRATKPG